MPKDIPSPAAISRQEALRAIWGYLGPVLAGNRLNPNAGSRVPSTRGSIQGAEDIWPTRLSSGLAHQIIKRGISSRAIGPLGDFLGLGKASVAELLDIDRSTANRRAAKDQLLPTHAAEGVLRMLELDQMAADTFETEEEAGMWLRTPHPMLEGDAPWEAAKSSYGAQRVKDILLAIKFGGVV